MKVVFRTQHPDALAAYRKALDDYDKWSEAIRVFAKEVHPDCRPMVGTTWGERRFDGLSVVEPIPEGWRRMKQKVGEDYLVPRRSVKVGKEWAKRMDALAKAPEVRGALPGMPTNVFSGMALLNPGVQEIDGTLYTTWSEDPRTVGADTGFSKVETVDEDIWEPMKLSEWYALQEAKEEMANA